MKTLQLFTILFGILLFHPSAKAQACLASDSLALVELYNATGGPNWTNSWDLNSPISTWHGVNINNCQVICLDLAGSSNCYGYGPGNNLTGALPDLNLPNLRRLYITKSDLPGTIPNFSKMPLLERLSLKNNNHSGSIPDFSNFPVLEKLDLGGNDLSGSLPDFSNLPALKEIWLSGNELSGSLPDFMNLPALEFLDLSFNNLSGSMTDFSYLPSIVSIRCGENQFTSVPDFTNIPTLKHLDMAVNELSGSITDFTNLPLLESLNYFSNKLTGTIPEFAAMPNLTHINLWVNELSGPLPQFNALVNLEEFNASQNNLSGSIPTYSNCPKLEELSLFFNQLTGTIPDFFDLPNLRELKFGNNLLSGSIPSLDHLSNLNVLSLGNNKLTGSIPDLKHVDIFSIIRNQFIFSDFTSSLDSNLMINSFKYAEQDSIATLQNGPTLSVHAGDIANNTYFWYKDSVLLATNVADSTFTPTTSGYYQCRVENANITRPSDYWKNLQLWSTVFYHEFTPLALSAEIIEINDLSCAAATDGSIAATGMGGTAPYNYAWSTGANSATISGLEAGNYTLTVTDADNNIATTTALVDEPDPQAPNLLRMSSFPPPNVPSCSNTSRTFTINDFDFSGNYVRYLFSINGSSVQDGPLENYTTTTTQNNDIVTAHAFDSNGCAYLVADTIAINAFPTPEITSCNFAPNELQITLSQGNPPWSFDLLAYEGNDLIATDSYTIYASDTTIQKSSNLHYEIQNLGLSNDACVYSDSYTTGQIDGCSAICVGYSSTYTESYTASFPSAPATVQWTILPADAIGNGDVVIVSGQNTATLALDFSNPNPIYQTISLQASATTACGTEVLTYEINLDPTCVWPGDVNMDGQDDIDPNINYIDDVLALEFARYDYLAMLNNQNGDILQVFEREPGCLAAATSKWEPQPADTWLLQHPNGSSDNADFIIKDSLGQPINTLNLKYADCNGNGDIETNQNWIQTMGTPFSSVINPTDHDIIVYQSINERAHDGNMPTAKMNNTTLAENLHIEASKDTIVNGEEVIFTVSLGAAGDTLKQVHHVAFVGEGAFGDYRQPAINVLNSHLTQGSSSKLVDYPFFNENYNGSTNDSLRWHVSVGRPENLSYGIDFQGEQVCQLICHMTIAGKTNKQNKVGGPIPVTFKIPAAGIILADGRKIYTQSQTDTIWVRPTTTLSANLLLEGPYEVTTGLMSDALRSSGLIPASEPFSQLDGYVFTHTEQIGLAMADSMAVLSVGGKGAIVDWVFIEVRDRNNATSLLSSRPALLTRNGNVVDMDGVSPPRLPIAAGDYYIAIRTRNHLGIMTAQPVYLGQNSPLVALAQNAAYGNGSKLLPDGNYVLYAGDTNGDGVVDAADRSALWNDRNKSDYLGTDCNLDGTVDAEDRSIGWNNRNRVVVY